MNFFSAVSVSKSISQIVFVIVPTYTLPFDALIKLFIRSSFNWYLLIFVLLVKSISQIFPFSVAANIILSEIWRNLFIFPSFNLYLLEIWPSPMIIVRLVVKFLN